MCFFVFVFILLLNKLIIQKLPLILRENCAYVNYFFEQFFGCGKLCNNLFVSKLLVFFVIITS